MNPVESNAWLILIAALAYLVGSFPTAYFVTRRMVGRDIRREGSHNVGAMNAYTLVGRLRTKKQANRALVTITLADLGKGILAVLAVRWLGFLGYNPLLALTAAAFFTILGHNYPFYFRFREGGIGFATLLGFLLTISLALLGIWGGTMLLSIFVAEHILVGRWRPESLAKIISVIGSQMPGRLIGLGIALILIYFLNSGLLFPVLGPTILIYIKHASRLKGQAG